MYDKPTQTNIQRVADEVDADPEVVAAVAEGCGRALTRSFGSQEVAAEFLNSGAEWAVTIALRDHMDTVQRMANRAQRDPLQFSCLVLDVLRDEAPA
ncbi:MULTISPECIES: hypothetical protein [unclassified Thioalkalivibrio]|uniref:hypothetical protein n=1 Tax=unclassified Thioalkalivibrio TaxID=2621013 RepID=UPI00037F763A|nr:MULTISPECIES: hypothetical protein [unclassified Thioalkalivibrio]